MALLRPLLLDNVPSIQQSAALALGRLASYSEDLAESVVSSQILPQLVYSLAEQNVPTLFLFNLYRDSIKKPLLSFLELLPSIQLHLPKPSLILALWMLSLSVLKSLTLQSRKLPLGHSVTSPSTQRSSPKLLSMPELFPFWFCVSKVLNLH